MQQIIQYLALLSFLILCYQGYRYAIGQNGVERQVACRNHGIFYMSIGITALVFKSPPIIIGGLVLIMLGLRLVALGLDRLDKTIFIDRYQEDIDDREG